MPKVDANVEEGTIGRWLKNDGERVAPGEPLVEIITDKATFELEAEGGGILRRRIAAEKSVVPAGYIIALLADSEDECLPDVSDENGELMRRHVENLLSGAGKAEVASTPVAALTQKDASSRVKATPAARCLARREGVALENIPVPEGKPVQESDVLQYIRQRRGAQGGGRDAS